MTLDTRFFLKALGTVGLASTFHPSTADEYARQEEGFGLANPPYLQNFNSETVSIVALFNKPCLAWVEILDKEGNIIQSIFQTEDGMRNANSMRFRFVVAHEGRDFSYQVVAKEVIRFDPYKIAYGTSIESPCTRTLLPFTTENENAHILILNDLHEQIDSYALLYNKSTLPKKDLVILNGDSFHYINKQQDLIDKLLAPVAKLFATHTPFIMVRGNHETRGEFARNFKEYFDFPENKFYHAFILRATFWIILDGGEDKPDSHEVYAQTVDYDSYRLEQKEWLSQILQSKEKKKAKHTVVVTHIPFFHSDDWHGTIHNRECFDDLLQKNNVTAVISGHTHQYGFYPPNADHNYHVIIGGGPKEDQRTLIEIISSQTVFNLVLKKENGEIIGSI